MLKHPPSYPNTMQASTLSVTSFGHFVSRRNFPREPSPICSDTRLQNYISAIMLLLVVVAIIARHGIHQNLSGLSVLRFVQRHHCSQCVPAAVSRDSPTTP